MLDQIQESAVRHKDGPCLLIAGPGAGKTTVLTSRIAYLIQEYKISPDHILVITFTKDAADEMKDRFMKKAGPSGASVTFGTFHSVFFRILKEYYGLGRENILSGAAKLKLLKEAYVLSEVKLALENDAFLSLEKEISLIANTGLDAGEFVSKILPQKDFLKFYRQYEFLKTEMKQLDFDDMLQKTKSLFLKDQSLLQIYRERYQYILIDEMQDMNELQFSIIRMLAEPKNNIFAVGDDDQSIYGFRGSDPTIMLTFPEIYPQCNTIYMVTNYRSCKTIVSKAGKIIANNKQRFDKDLTAFQEEEGKISYKEVKNAEEEADELMENIHHNIIDGQAKKSMAILFRNHSQSIRVMKRLSDEGIPYQVKEGIPGIYDHFIMLDLVSYLNLAVKNYKREYFLRVANRPNRYLSRASMNDPKLNFEKWKNYFHNSPSLIDSINRMEKGLNLMSKLNPYAAINFIRRGMGYDDFLKEYAKSQEMDYAELVEIIDEIQTIAKLYKTIDAFLDALIVLRQQDKDNKKDADSQALVSLYTFHGSKGLEFDTVYIMDVNEGITPSSKATKESELEEERRMFYVALTRAKSEAFLYSVRERHNEKLYPSRYLSEMSESAAS